MRKKIYKIFLYFIFCIAYFAQVKSLSSVEILTLKSRAKKFIENNNYPAAQNIINQLRRDPKTVKESSALEKLLASQKAKNLSSAQTPAQTPPAKVVPVKQVSSKQPEDNQRIIAVERQLKEKDNALKAIAQQLTTKDALIQELRNEADRQKADRESCDKQVKETNKEKLETDEQNKQYAIQLQEKDQKIEALEKDLAQRPPVLPPRDHPPKELRPLPPTPTKVEEQKELSSLEKQLAAKKEQLTKPKEKKELSFLEQIQQGATLKPVDATERKPEVPAKHGQSLVDTLSEAIEKRRGALREDVKEDADDENGDWEP